MPAAIEIKTAAEERYPTPADAEAGAVERGWKSGWTISVQHEGDSFTRYLGYLGESFNGVIEDEDAALAEAIAQSEKDGIVLVRLSEISAYDREQVAAERAFEARVG